MKKTTLAAVVLVLSAAGLAGCGAGSSADNAPRPAEQAASLSMTGAWAKAAEAGGMTGAFGTLENSGPEDLTIVSAASPAAEAVELHEVAMDDDGAMVMREIEGGFVVPADSSYVLEPGASHLMLMGLQDGLLAGDTVTVTLELADGSTLDIDATAKDFSGANESYGTDEGHGADSHGTGTHGSQTHGSGETSGHADH